MKNIYKLKQLIKLIIINNNNNKTQMNKYNNNKINNNKLNNKKFNRIKIKCNKKWQWKKKKKRKKKTFNSKRQQINSKINSSKTINNSNYKKKKKTKIKKYGFVNFVEKLIRFKLRNKKYQKNLIPCFCFNQFNKKISSNLTMILVSSGLLTTLEACPSHKKCKEI